MLVGFGYNEPNWRVMTAPKGGERPFQPGQRSAIGDSESSGEFGPGPSQLFAGKFALCVCRRERH